MIGIAFKFTDQTKRITEAVDKAAYRNFAHAAASIRRDAKASIKKAKKQKVKVAPAAGAKKRDKKGRFKKGKRPKTIRVKAAAGEPPNTKRGQLPRAIAFQADKEGAVIGPQFSAVGEAGAAHEHGEEFKGDEFAQRPYMGPALERQQARFASDWAGTI